MLTHMLAFACGTLIQSPVKPCPHPAGTKDLGKGTTAITERVLNFLWRKGKRNSTEKLEDLEEDHSTDIYRTHYSLH